MSIAVNVSPVRNFRAGLRTGLRPDWSVRLAVATGGLSAIVIGLELVRPIHVTSPSGRAALETLIALSAIFTARLLVANFQDSGRLPDLMLLCALSAVSLTDFAYCAVPALADGVRPEAGGGARLCCSLIVSVAFAAAAFAPSKVIRYPGPGQSVAAILAGAAIVTLSQFIEQATGSHWNATLQDVGIQGAIAASGRAHRRTCGGGLAGRVGARVPPPRSAGRNPLWTPRSAQRFCWRPLGCNTSRYPQWPRIGSPRARA